MFKITYRMDEEILREAAKSLFRLRPLTLVSLSLILLGVGILVIVAHEYAMLFFLILPVFVLLSPSMSRKEFVQKNQLRCAELYDTCARNVSVQTTPDCIMQTDEMNGAVNCIPYSVFVHAGETPNLLWLKTASGYLVIIPKRFFTSDQLTNLKFMLNEKCELLEKAI